jgi:hypothetical protein
LIKAIGDILSSSETLRFVGARRRWSQLARYVHRLRRAHQKTSHNTPHAGISSTGTSALAPDESASTRRGDESGALASRAEAAASVAGTDPGIRFVCNCDDIQCG